ncbi:MAG: hypothetical protein J6X61_04245 [Clostridia bacterium]|nr:hypothetical protein [Clostridia bacterium]
MKRMTASLLALALLLTACTGAPTDVASSRPASSGGTGASGVLPSSEGASSAALSSNTTATDPSSAAALSSEAATSAASSSAATSSKAASSKAASSRAPQEPTGGPVDVDAIFASSGKKMTDDVSACFPAGAPAFIINGGTAGQPYLVDKATILRLAETPCEGTGYVKWKDFSKTVSSISNPDPFTGVIPVSKLDDPVYLSTALPSEVNTFMARRVNASNLYATAAKHVKAVTIGAVYRNEDNKPADNVTATLCIRNIRLLYHSAKTGWFVAESVPVPTTSMVNHMYYLPWELSHTLGTYPLRNEVTRTSDHVEIQVGGNIFNATPFITDGRVTAKDGTYYPYNKIPVVTASSTKYYTLTATCLHFWGTSIPFANFGLDGSQIDGMVSAFQVWIKEPELTNKFGVAIGIDLRDADNNINQSYSGRNYKITTDPQWVIGHNIGPKAYDAIVDTETVQKLIGMI